MPYLLGGSYRFEPLRAIGLVRCRSDSVSISPQATRRTIISWRFITSCTPTNMQTAQIRSMRLDRSSSQECKHVQVLSSHPRKDRAKRTETMTRSYSNIQLPSRGGYRLDINSVHMAPSPRNLSKHFAASHRTKGNDGGRRMSPTEEKRGQGEAWRW